MIPVSIWGRPQFILLFATALLGACDDRQQPTAVLPVEPPASTETAQRPAFSMDEVGAVELVKKIEPEWSEPWDRQRSSDSFSGGESISLSYKGGSVSIFTNPEGKVWRMRVNRGFGERCGKYANARAYAADFIKAIDPGASGEQLDGVARKIADALAGTELLDPVDFRISRIAVMSSCVKGITATAI